MSTSLEVHRTLESGPLSVTRVAEAFARIRGGGVPRVRVHERELRAGLALSPDDAACAAVRVDFAGGGRLDATARGPSVALLRWCVHAIARDMGCAVVDPETGVAGGATPEAFLEEAIAYVTDYERDVARDRVQSAAAGGAGQKAIAEAFFAWLAREGHVALAGDAESAAVEIPIDDAERLYELLLESPAVDDVFVSESELTALLSRYRARFRPSAKSANDG